MLGACKVADHDSFATPTDTLLTFQAKLARDDPNGEYRCLSERFKERCHGLFGYLPVRDRVLDAHTLERFLLVRNDLQDNIVAERYAEDERTAMLKVSLWGTTVDFYFRKEVLLRLRFAGAPDREQFLDRPAAEVYRLSANRGLGIELGELDTDGLDARLLRATEVEELWKLDGFERTAASEE